MTQQSLPLTAPEIDRKALRQQAIAAIKEHLDKEGAVDWSSVRAKFPSVPERTWWRWVASAKKAQSGTRLGEATNPGQPSEASTVVGLESGPQFILQEMPVTRLASMIVQQMKDIDLLQRHAMTEDGKIRNPTIFAQALTLRERQMTSFVKTLGPMMEHAAWEDLVNSLLAAVEGIDKNVAIQLINGLQDVQRKVSSGTHTPWSPHC